MFVIPNFNSVGLEAASPVIIFVVVEERNFRVLRGGGYSRRWRERREVWKEEGKRESFYVSDTILQT